VVRIGIQPRDGSRVRWIFGDGFHVRGDLPGVNGGHLAEVRARDSVQFERKLIALDARDAVGEVVDRVVCDGQRAMPAGIFHFELIIGVKFFACVYRHHRRLAIARVNPAAVGVQDEFGVHQIAMSPQQPVHAV
jgi:hypothetical protein